MKSNTDLINEAIDRIEEIGRKLTEIISNCEAEEGNEPILDAVKASATPLVNAYNALENILSAIEDKEPA